VFAWSVAPRMASSTARKSPANFEHAINACLVCRPLHLLRVSEKTVPLPAAGDTRGQVSVAASPPAQKFSPARRGSNKPFSRLRGTQQSDVPTGPGPVPPTPFAGQSSMISALPPLYHTERDEVAISSGTFSMSASEATALDPQGGDRPRLGRPLVSRPQLGQRVEQPPAHDGTEMAELSRRIRRRGPGPIKPVGPVEP